jgi:hypothetical protein
MNERRQRLMLCVLPTLHLDLTNEPMTLPVLGGQGLG